VFAGRSMRHPRPWLEQLIEGMGVLRALAAGAWSSAFTLALEERGWHQCGLASAQGIGLAQPAGRALAEHPGW